MTKIVVFKRATPVKNSATNYRSLRTWQMAYQLVLDIYPLLDKLPPYESNNLADQIRRAVTSLPLNITEGASSRFRRVFYNHLNYAYASAQELEVLIMLLKDLKYVDIEAYDKIYLQLDDFKRQTYKFMIYVESGLKKDSFEDNKNDEKKDS